MKLKNFRSMWVGATESNLERILKILSALTPVGVVVDEVLAVGDEDVRSAVADRLGYFSAGGPVRPADASQPSEYSPPVSTRAPDAASRSSVALAGCPYGFPAPADATVGRPLPIELTVHHRPTSEDQSLS